MEAIPTSTSLSNKIKKVLSVFEKRINLPKINPYSYYLTTIILSFSFFYLESARLKIIIMLLVLISDWLDNATIRQHYKNSVDSWTSDVLINRLSEGLIFTAEVDHRMGKLFFLLWLGNIMLSFHSVEVKKHLILPIRFLYIFILLFQIF